MCNCSAFQLLTIEQRLAEKEAVIYIEEYHENMQATETVWVNYVQGTISNEIITFFPTFQFHSNKNVKFQPLNHVLCARFPSNVMTTEKRKKYRPFRSENLSPNTL